MTTNPIGVDIKESDQFSSGWHKVEMHTISPTITTGVLKLICVSQRRIDDLTETQRCFLFTLSPRNRVGKVGNSPGDQRAKSARFFVSIYLHG